MPLSTMQGQAILDMIKRIREAARAVIDTISETTGIWAIPELLPMASNDNEVTLNVPGYCQVNTYACGAVAGLMVLKTFRPKASTDAFYRRVNPHPEPGCGTGKLIRALRRSGLGVSDRDDLTFHRLCREIDEGFPVIVVIENPLFESSHWIVIYGYGRKPDRVFLATNGFPILNRKIVPRKDFERIWRPRGNGLVVWGW